jgi:hypothetical protein
MNDSGFDAGLNSSAGGARAASGLTFQAQVFAWWAAHAVGGAAPGLGLDPQVRVEAVGCETDFPVDDVGVALSNGGFILVQAKSGMRRLDPRAQDLCEAVDQLVSAMIGGLRSGAPMRPVEVWRDRLVIATNQNSSQAFRALGDVCARLRDLPVSVPLDAAAVNEDQKRAYTGLLSIVRSSWTATTGREPEDDELRNFLRVLEVSRFDFEGDTGADRIRCEAMLQHASIPRPFSVLVGIGIEAAQSRTWRDKRALITAMGSGHSPQSEEASYAGRLLHLRHGQVPHVRDIAGHVFISYVREDSHRVDRLQRTLQAAGIPVWRDTADLWPGEDWRAEIRRAITDNALVFIACFSHASLARGRSYQNEELTLAIEQLRLRRPDDPWLIPVRFDECEIPDRDIGGGRTLTSIQHADLFGDRSDESATRLVVAIRRILGVNSDAVGPEEDPEPDLADPAERDGKPAGQMALNRSSASGRQRPTLVMVDGDYLVAALQASGSISADFHSANQPPV